MLNPGQASGMGFFDTTSSGKNCYLFINGNKEIISSILSVAFLVCNCFEPYVIEDELKLMLRGAELSGAIEEEEQNMIETVLEIKDTHVREAMTPLVDVVAIDASATLVDFHHLWVTHQYSRVPVFEQRVDDIVGIAYAMDLLDFVWKICNHFNFYFFFWELVKGEQLESSTMGEMAHKLAYFVPDSMSVWNLLREFGIRKVHMAVLNEYGGTVGICAKPLIETLPKQNHPLC
ncbi:hypothetical protein SLEP1_g58498 [Rubroshorea leprosula]|uniref:CBS domain-containing protein n=1 Tax=Rubroshorea leprosula TaxID=152421 RepID=A0AAV5MPH2_9ROSI|nr:hypothetical protein SLEP1_g58498 [Rubroshorea leprosula]